MCIAFRGPVHPWRFDHLPCLSFSPVPSENGNQPTSTWVQWITRRTNRFLPLVGTYTSWGAAFGRWPWQSLILWEGGEAFEETLRCILVHSCHASRPRANRWKTMDGISCRKTDVCASICAFAICEGFIRYSNLPSFFSFPMKFPSSPHRLLPGSVAYEKLEILKKNLDAPEQLHRMWQEVFDEISSKYEQEMHWIFRLPIFLLWSSQISNGWLNAISSRCQPDLGRGCACCTSGWVAETRLVSFFVADLHSPKSVTEIWNPSR